jgi:hypothetical protein
MSQHITERRSAVLREIFDRSPELGRALDIARGPCLRFQGTHPSMAATMAQWFYEAGNDGYTKFERMADWEVNYLERAVENGDTVVTYAWKVKYHDDNGQVAVDVTPYHIDLIAMTQKNMNTGKVRRLLRFAEETSHAALSAFK